MRLFENKRQKINEQSCLFNKQRYIDALGMRDSLKTKKFKFYALFCAQFSMCLSGIQSCNRARILSIFVVICKSVIRSARKVAPHDANRSLPYPPLSYGFVLSVDYNGRFDTKLKSSEIFRLIPFRASSSGRIILGNLFSTLQRRDVYETYGLGCNP